MTGRNSSLRRGLTSQVPRRSEEDPRRFRLPRLLLYTTLGGWRISCIPRRTVRKIGAWQESDLSSVRFKDESSRPVRANCVVVAAVRP